ncbi:putative lipid II flippase FtsW [Tomitella gaofuii]|uniref:putative lipid II flippase FtsW n=1 Tax=Tomitella gaofuii TaxID=2760083 RepID=UPI0027E3E002|nr:putative lipid II flippase FtsW [Tomitella gaofuii]
MGSGESGQAARRGSADRAAQPAGKPASGGAPAGGRSGIAVWLSGPLMSFHLVVTVTALLTLSGLAMVLSASSVASYTEDGSAYSMFNSQLMYSIIGAMLFYLAMRVPVSWVRRLATPAIGVAVLLLVLVLVPGIGVEVQGARRWIDLGPFSLQPSEVMKLVLVIWGAHILTRGKTMPGLLGDPRLRLGFVSVFTFALVMLQPNLSTTIALALIVGALLWFSGLSVKSFAVLAAICGALALVLGLSAGYRAERIQSFLNPGSDPKHGGYQALQAKFSLADGGLFGRGPGQSRAKWNYLPNSHNDFIFAIIGEELGLVGGLVVIALFVLFAYAGLRIMLRSADPFLRLLVAGITVWTIAQAFINIGYVVGLLPVTGLQLPLISAGGSSTTITLAAFGLMANAARHEPEAVAALRSGRESRLPKLLRLPLPEPYRPERGGVVRAATHDKRAQRAQQHLRRRRADAAARAGGPRSGQARGAQPTREARLRQPRGTHGRPAGGTPYRRSGAAPGGPAAGRGGAGRTGMGARRPQGGSSQFQHGGPESRKRGDRW